MSFLSSPRARRAMRESAVYALLFPVIIEVLRSLTTGFGNFAARVANDYIAQVVSFGVIFLAVKMAFAYWEYRRMMGREKAGLK